MAGIKEALKRVSEHRNIGYILAKGKINHRLPYASDYDEVYKIKYIIVQLMHDGGYVTQYDYGSDVRFQDGLKVGDEIILMIRDNWTAEWIKYNKEEHLR